MTSSTAEARAPSSRVATAAAAIFIVLAAALSFVGDNEGTYDDWRLRGTLSPWPALNARARVPAPGKGV